MQVLKHDGLGTEAAIAAPIENIFNLEPDTISKQTVFKATLPGPILTVVPEAKSRDINNDGKQTMADVSIFMTDLVSKNLRSDLNGDGEVDLKDLSILTE